jgi:hypothetical protein
MGEIGRAKSLPNWKRKPLIVPLIMPSQDELKLDEASATGRHQKLKNRCHDSDITYDSLRHIGHLNSFHSLPRAENRDNEKFSPLIPTEALIGKLS